MTVWQGLNSELLPAGKYSLSATGVAQEELSIYSSISTVFLAVLLENGIFCCFTEVLREHKIICCL